MFTEGGDEKVDVITGNVAEFFVPGPIRFLEIPFWRSCTMGLISCC